MIKIQKSFFSKVNINTEILDCLNSGIAIFNEDLLLVYANSAYLSMYNLTKDSHIGLKATDLFLTAKHGTMEVLRTGKANNCVSITVNGYYGVTNRHPLRDKSGKTIGVMTENISVGFDKQRIYEIQKIIKNLKRQSSFTPPEDQEPARQQISFESILGENPAMQLVKTKGIRFAQHDEPILIVGENGTGKDLLAQALHMGSSRATQSFVSVNCAALPENLIEAELFGYEAGAFTGAHTSGKKGKFEAANGGTIFLDEIGELPLNLQAKLLRVLENHEIQKLGNPKPIYVDFRLISATNRNLEHLVETGLLREDLFYRLNLFELSIPPLRERVSDIPLLSYAILKSLAGPQRCQELRIANEVISLFRSHFWRGNVRELRNVVTYALYGMSPGEKILQIHHLPERFLSEALNQPQEEDMGIKLGQSCAEKEQASQHFFSNKQTELEKIKKALAESEGNKVQAARLLGIARSNLYKKMAQFNLK